MYHYTYLIEFPNGMKYVGAHSTHIKPTLDTRYLGSGRALPKRTPKTCVKTILQVFNTRKDAIKAEIAYIIKNDCCNSDLYYNIRKCTFDRHGSKTPRKSVHKRRVQDPSCALFFKGINRTPAQKAGAISMRQKLTGTKNPAKAHKSISNQAFVPWYYIDPQGTYTEMLTTTKREFAQNLNTSERILGHRFHWSNQHKVAKRTIWKGWIFGNLPKPENTDSN